MIITRRNIIMFGISLLLASCMPADRIYPNVTPEDGSGNGGNRPFYPEKPYEPSDAEGGFAPEGYMLVWGDEFNDRSSLYSKWKFEQGGTGWGNEELQYYCDQGIYGPTGQQTARIEDGNLLITAYRADPADENANCHYISARMNSIHSWKYGYIEMRAKLPVVGGCWPAFWMLPKDGHHNIATGGGEMDIMEWVANEPETVWFSAHSKFVTTGQPGRYTDPVTGKKYRHSEGSAITNPDTEYHCFGMEWTHEYVKAYLDGVEYCYCPNPNPDTKDQNWWPFDKEYYIKLNLAIGGSWGGNVDPAFESATYTVDWVRVYQK